MDINLLDAYFIAAGLSLALVLAALGVARLTGPRFAVGLTGLGIVGCVVGEWLMTIWFFAVSAATRGDADHVLEIIWSGHAWLISVGLVAIAIWGNRRMSRVDAGAPSLAARQVRRSSRFHH